MKKMSTDNLLRMLASLILGMLLWVYAVSDSNPMTTQNYSALEIHYTGQDSLSSNHLMLQSQTSSINVTLYGRSQQLGKIKSANLYAFADLSGITQEGTYTVLVQINGVPNNVSISGISPEYITIDVLPIYEKTFDFSLDNSGSAANGYAMTNYTTNVNEVTVTGNQDEVDRIAKIAGQFSLDGHNSDFTATSVLKAYASDGTIISGITISPSSIEVAVSIDATKTVDLNVITSGECPKGYYLKSAAAAQSQVTIAGDSALLKNITSVSTQSVSLNGQNASFSKNIAIELPDGISVIGGNTVTVNIDIEAYYQSTFTYDSIQIRNIPSGLSCDLSSFSKLSITLQGNKDVLDSIKADDITVFIDLAGLTKGTHSVTIQYTVPNGVTVKTISMKQVSVVLQ